MSKDPSDRLEPSAGKRYFTAQLIVTIVATVGLVVVGLQRGISDPAFWILVAVLAVVAALLVAQRIRRR